MKIVRQNQAQKIRLDNDGNRGAYLCPVTLVDGRLERGDTYYHGISTVVEMVEFDPKTLPDGWYEYREISGPHSSYGYIQIQGGEWVDEAFDDAAAIAALTEQT